MRTFDVTFSGAVLPDHEPATVRRDLAQLFCIDNPDVVDQLFSGEKVILRHAMDRKAAADLFRQITIVGGKAELVARSSKPEARPSADVTLSQDDGQPVRLIRRQTRNFGVDPGDLEPRAGERDQSWPLSRARAPRKLEKMESVVAAMQAASPHEPQPVPEPEPAPVASAIPQPQPQPETVPEPPAPVATAEPETEPETELETAEQIETVESIDPTPRMEAPVAQVAAPAITPTDTERELRRLEQLRQRTLQKNTDESSRLERRIEQFDRIAEQELAKIRSLSHNASENCERDLLELDSRSGETRASREQEIARVERNIEAARERHAQSGEELRSREAKIEEQKQSTLSQLEEERERIESRLEDEILRLEQMIVEAREKAETEFARVEAAMATTDGEAQAEIALIAEQRERSEPALEAELQALTQEADKHRELMAKDEEQLAAQKRAIHTLEDQELARLTAMEVDITTRREEGIATARAAQEELQQDTEATLQRLETLMERVRRLQASNDSAAVAPPTAQLQQI